MSMSDEDYAYDEYLADEAEHEFYEKAVSEFTAERLKSYFLENKSLFQSVLIAHKESNRLLEECSSNGGALAFAAISIEVCVKNAFLKPIIYGLVHQESLASLITELAVEKKGFLSLKKSIFELLLNLGDVDLRAERRVGTRSLFWEEITLVMHERNFLMHKGEIPQKENAEIAIKVSEHIIQTIIPTVLRKLKLGLNKEGNIEEIM